MSDMEEILFWVHTKRAPCLMNFDNVIKKQNEANFSSGRPRSTRSSVEEAHSPKKKKKRKLSELDESVSPEKQKNLFFETSQQSKKAVISICRSDTADSDVDFNIKDSSVQYKSKKMRLQKSRTTLHRKNKVFTSTPKVATALRRSRRRMQHNNYNAEVNITFQHMDTTNNDKRPENILIQDKFQSPEIMVNGSRGVNNVIQTTVKVEMPKTNHTMPNGQFEDLSDVSGFTANYIRSTKLQSTRAPRALQHKGPRHLVKESRPITKQQDNEKLPSVNKPANTSKGSKVVTLNCSTDSSQNILNITSLRNKRGNVKKVDASTSALKFIESKVQKKIDADEMNGELNNKSDCVKVNIPIKPRTILRYPRRRKDNTANVDDLTTTNTPTDQSPDKRKSLINIRSSTLNDSDLKENPEDFISRTRSGRPIGLRVREPSNSVLAVNNFTERVSTVTINVAVATDKDQSTGNLGNSKKCRNSSGVKYVRRAADSSTPAHAPRDRSGYKQCFSDSDNDSEPPKERKFFC